MTLTSGGLVFDDDFRLAGTVPCGNDGGVAVNAGTIGYSPGPDSVAVCDLVRFRIIRVFATELFQVGRLAISPDGERLVGLTALGVVIVTP